MMLLRKRRWLWVIIPLLSLVVVGMAAVRWGLPRPDRLRRRRRAGTKLRTSGHRRWRLVTEREKPLRPRTSGRPADDDFATRERELVERCRDYAGEVTREHRANSRGALSWRLATFLRALLERRHSRRSRPRVRDGRPRSADARIEIPGPAPPEEPIQSLAGILLKRVREAPDERSSPRSFGLRDLPIGDQRFHSLRHRPRIPSPRPICSSSVTPIGPASKISARRLA